jgi:hypothetical protein
MAVRGIPAAQAVRDRVLAEAPGARLDVMELDLSSMASVRAFASQFVARGLPLNILVYVYTVPNLPFVLPTACMRATWDESYESMSTSIRGNH